MTSDTSKPIAYGRTAEVYAWEPGWVLKLFYDWFDPESIAYEARVCRAIHAAGLPVPAVGEMVDLHGRRGLLYQRVDGTPMWEVFSRRPWLGLGLSRRMAELHAEMHAKTIEAAIPAQRQKLLGKLARAKALPASLRTRALAALDTLPDGHQLCHGDFHPGNILVTAHGETIIDWIDASLGNPLADLARTTILIRGAVETRQIPNRLMRVLVRVWHAAYLQHYFRIRPGGETEYRCWLPVVAAARLSEDIPEVEQWLVAQANAGLPGE